MAWQVRSRLGAAVLGWARHGLAWLGVAWQGAARPGTGGWSAAGFDSRPPALVARRDWARQCSAWHGSRAAGLGAARQGVDSGVERAFTAGHGTADLGPACLGWARQRVARPVWARGTGDWQAPEFKPPAPDAVAAGSGWAWCGKAGLGPARQCPAGQGEGGWMVSGAVRLRTTHATVLGTVRPGQARPGLAWRCPAWQGTAGGWSQSGFDSPALTRGWSWLRKAMRGEARRGSAWRGLVRRCEARQGAGEWHTPRFESLAPTRGTAWPARAWPGRARRGMAWCGWSGLVWAVLPMAGLGKESGERHASRFESWTPTRGMARRGDVGSGLAWRGAARQAIAWPAQARLVQAPRGVAGQGKEPQWTEEIGMFKTLGDRPQWQAIYDHLAGMSIGDVVKDETLAALLPDAPEGSVYSAYRRAVRQVEDDLKRTFARVRTVGYRMVDANEHEGLARGHHKRAKRQLKTAKRKAVSADRSRLSREERARLDAVELNLSRQIEMTNRLSARMEKVESDLKAARREQQTDAAHLAERVDRLAALLVKHGLAEAPAAQAA